MLFSSRYVIPTSLTFDLTTGNFVFLIRLCCRVVTKTDLGDETSDTFFSESDCEEGVVGYIQFSTLSPPGCWMKRPRAKTKMNKFVPLTLSCCQNPYRIIPPWILITTPPAQDIQPSKPDLVQRKREIVKLIQNPSTLCNTRTRNDRLATIYHFEVCRDIPRPYWSRTRSGDSSNRYSHYHQGPSGWPSKPRCVKTTNESPAERKRSSLRRHCRLIHNWMREWFGIELPWFTLSIRRVPEPSVGKGFHDCNPSREWPNRQHLPIAAVPRLNR